MEEPPQYSFYFTFSPCLPRSMSGRRVTSLFSFAFYLRLFRKCINRHYDFTSASAEGIQHVFEEKLASDDSAANSPFLKPKIWAPFVRTFFKIPYLTNDLIRMIYRPFKSMNALLSKAVHYSVVQWFPTRLPEYSHILVRMSSGTPLRPHLSRPKCFRVRLFFLKWMWKVTPHESGYCYVHFWCIWIANVQSHLSKFVIELPNFWSVGSCFTCRAANYLNSFSITLRRLNCL